MRAISLLYHDVVEKGDFDSSGFSGRAPASFKLEIDEFQRHLGHIADAIEINPITVVQLLSPAKPASPLLITFDDGGSSAYHYIADAMESQGWLGHFFVTVDYIGTTSFLSRRQIRELRERGHIIGTHSCSHRRGCRHVAGKNW